MIQDFFVRYYDYRPFPWTWANKLLGNASKVLSWPAQWFLPRWFRCTPFAERYLRLKAEGKVAPVVACLTSFPQRISTVWLVVECLLRQSLPPREIVLYLAQSQFPSAESVPGELRRYERQGVLTIHRVDPDIRSHKKYWFAVNQYPNQALLTVDDDIIYDSHFVEHLMQCAQRYPHTVSACYCRPMKWKDGHLLPYSQWGGQRAVQHQPSRRLFFGSGGGTWFPAGSLKGADLPVEELCTICPTADDIWLNAVIRKNGYGVCAIRGKISVLEWRIPQNVTLHATNNLQGRNDLQLEQVVQHFLHHTGRHPFAEPV